jgi:pimeloyl-ACP methyl ester carboxylesterase
VRRLLITTLALAAALAPAAAAQTAATAPTRTLQAGKTKIGYRAFGEGRPIVFVMGLGGTLDAWDPTFLDRVVRQGRRVIVFDNAGIGRSSRRGGTLTIAGMADTTATLIRRLKLGRPDVFGWSMGGMISQSLAVRHPRLVRRLVLAATAPGVRGAVFPEADVLANFDPANALATLFPPEATQAPERFVRNLATRRRIDLTVPAAIQNAQIGASGRWLLGQDPDGAKVRRLRIPVLVGGGEKDRVLPVANQRLLDRIIPRARLVTYPDAAHGFFVQHAADFARRVDRFLG